MPTEYQLRDLQLHARIRRCLDEGRLPVFLPDSIGAGYGSVYRCHACDQPISPDEIEYNVQDPSSGAARLRLHLGCYVLWQTECVKRIRTQRQDSPCSQPGPLNGSRKKKDPGRNGRNRMTRHP